MVILFTQTRLLPKLPLPNIPDTLARYINAVQAVVTPDQLQTTKRNLEEFSGDTDLIQDVSAALAKRNEEKDNWAYQYWLDDMYLKPTLPLPIFSNASFVFPKQKFNSQSDWCVFMAHIAQGIFSMKRSIERGQVSVDYVKGKGGEPQPLCMAQHYRLFNTHRCPGKNGDYHVESDPRQARDNETITVLNKARIFDVTVRAGGKWIDNGSLAKLFYDILNTTQDSNLPMEDRLPVLTTSTRDIWAENHEDLCQDPVNANMIDRIQRSLFCVCLDELPQNHTDLARSEKSRIRQGLSGEGPYVNGCNRWYDKALQVFSSMDGMIGLCMEHSVAEGIAVDKVISDAYTYAVLSDRSKVDMPNEVNERFHFRELKPNLNNDLRCRIRQAVTSFNRLASDHDAEILKFDGFGKAFMKGCKCSPDAFMQMSLQLAFYSLYGRLCFTYESASTRRFRQGRVDNIRASHPEALRWVAAMSDEAVDKDERLRLFKEAINKQTCVMLENITGRGMDIPMLGIRETCKALRPNQRISLFEDEVFKKINFFELSTSQLTMTYPDSFGGYGAVIPEGYGVSYNLQEDHIIFSIASFFSCHETSSIRMADAIEQSLWAISDLFE